MQRKRQCEPRAAIASPTSLGPGGAFSEALAGKGMTLLFVGVSVCVIFVSLVPAEQRRSEGRSMKPGKREGGIAEKLRKVFEGRAVEQAVDVGEPGARAGDETVSVCEGLGGGGGD